MAANEIHKDDIGTVFTLTVKDGSAVVNVASASSKLIKFRKPGGVIISKTAEFVTDGTDGKISLTVNQGVAPYSYVLSGSATGNATGIATDAFEIVTGGGTTLVPGALILK